MRKFAMNEDILLHMVNNDPDENIRMMALAKLSKEYWEYSNAAHDKSVNVRRFFAECGPLHLIRLMINDSDSEVRGWIARRIDLNDELMIKLSLDDSYLVKSIIIDRIILKP